MSQFDTIVVGNDILSLTTVLFLARKMRNVVLITDPSYKDEEVEVITITDPENNEFRFEYQRNNEINGLPKQSLMTQYLATIGLALEINSVPYVKDIIVGLDNSFTERILSFEQFRTYLVRYYPKQRDQIHKFFRDLERHYHNFVTQYVSMLVNTDYTLTSLMIEWGDYSLLDLLSKYFRDGRIVEEFMLNNQINGLNPSEINSYHFFMNFFLGLKDGISYLKQNNKELRKLLIEKINIISPKIIVSTKIKSYIKDDSGKIVGFIDSRQEEYRSKFFVINQDPIEFYTQHFPELKEETQILSAYYPNLKSTRRVNTLFIALNQKSTTLGLNNLTYYFKNNYDSLQRIIRIFQYKLFDNDVCKDSHSAICVDFTYDESSPFTTDDILKRIYEVFPKLKKSVVGMKLGKPRPYLSMLSEESVRKGLSINDQISIESGEHTQLFDNLYLTGTWLRPEASVFGWFHSGIVLADKIEELLYYGEADDSFYYLTNDEIMIMIRHNYTPSDFNLVERHVNFHIGKSDYFVRTKKKTITIHRGLYSNPDLTIYSTNDKLSNLLLKKLTFQEALQSGGFKYQGNAENLYDVINNFRLDDYQEYTSKEFRKMKINFLGVKFLYLYLLVYSFAVFLTNYLEALWIMPVALALHLGVMYLKYRVYKSITWFEYVIIAIYVFSILLRLIYPNALWFAKDDPYLLIMGLLFFISWAFNIPIVYDFHRYDYREDYAKSILFRVITNGLTFLWALVFLGIPIMTFFSGERYVSVLYNFVFLGIFMTYYYPIIYVKTNIKI